MAAGNAESATNGVTGVSRGNLFYCFGLSFVIFKKLRVFHFAIAPTGHSAAFPAAIGDLKAYTNGDSPGEQLFLRQWPWF